MSYPEDEVEEEEQVLDTFGAAFDSHDDGGGGALDEGERFGRGVNGTAAGRSRPDNVVQSPLETDWRSETRGNTQLLLPLLPLSGSQAV